MRQGLNRAGTYLLEMIILFLYKFKTASKFYTTIISFSTHREFRHRNIRALSDNVRPPESKKKYIWRLSSSPNIRSMRPFFSTERITFDVLE